MAYTTKVYLITTFFDSSSEISILYWPQDPGPLSGPCQSGGRGKRYDEPWTIKLLAWMDHFYTNFIGQSKWSLQNSARWRWINLLQRVALSVTWPSLRAMGWGFTSPTRGELFWIVRIHHTVLVRESTMKPRVFIIFKNSFPVCNDFSRSLCPVLILVGHGRMLRKSVCLLSSQNEWKAEDVIILIVHSQWACSSIPTKWGVGGNLLKDLLCCSLVALTLGLYSLGNGFEAIRTSSCLTELFPLGCFQICPFPVHLFLNADASDGTRLFLALFSLTERQ